MKAAFPHLVGALVLVAAAACSVDPYCLECQEGEGTEDGSVDDHDATPGASDAGDAASADGSADACVEDERCNELDDDCDGMVDEDFDTGSDPRNCGGCGMACAPSHAFGECVGGECGIESCDVGYHDLDDDPDNGCEYPCLATAEDDGECDLRDGDCDGEVDEDVDFDGDADNCGSCGRVCRFAHATAACEAGDCTIASCNDSRWDLNGDPVDGCEYACSLDSPSDEVCDGEDDDCDGAVDEGDPGGGASCGTDVGACSTGTLHCTGGSLSCLGAVDPSSEACNGVDDDSDGETDEEVPGLGASCGTDVGTCSPGTRACTDGALICEGEVGPAAELCNGLDDDCDASVDEGDPEGGASCGGGMGTCTPGSLTCLGGVLRCEGETTPSPKTCNGVDDDCDGTADEDFDLANDVTNCGSCGTICSYANANARCSSGACAMASCDSGFHDLDLDDTNGCEYACDFRGAEVCNGIDDDCDGDTDEGLSAPTTFCNPNGVCAGTAPTCRGSAGWTCTYPSSYEDTETRCDGLDNDCDGSVDEPYPLAGTACANGLGTCRRTGTYMCNGTEDGILCTAPAAGSPADEVCNNEDDDCDGTVDERVPDDPGTSWRDGIDLTAIDTVAVSRAGGGTMRIMQYEASRPDATASDLGSVNTFACSRSGVVPWTNVTWTEARDACCALNPSGTCPGDTESGWRLCPAEDWEQACLGPTGTCEWSYEASCDASQPLVCNGREHDCDPARPGNQDCPYVTGSAEFPGCRTDWGAPGAVHDLSGNAREWTSTERSTGEYELRGGSYTSFEAGRSCTFDFAVAGAGFAHPGTGFRCCHW